MAFENVILSFFWKVAIYLSGEKYFNLFYIIMVERNEIGRFRRASELRGATSYNKTVIISWLDFYREVVANGSVSNSLKRLRKHLEVRESKSFQLIYYLLNALVERRWFY